MNTPPNLVLGIVTGRPLDIAQAALINLMCEAEGVVYVGTLLTEEQARQGYRT